MKHFFHKRQPFYLLLLPLFYILHITNEYYALLPVKAALGYLLLYLAVIFLLSGLGYLVFRSFLKAALWAFCLLLTGLFFGKVHDMLKEAGLPHFLTGYSLLLPCILLLWGLITWLLKKPGKAPIKLNSYLNLVFFVFLLIEVYSLSANMIAGKDRKNDLAYYNRPLPADTAAIAASDRPDIFFIVFDEYASSLSLKKYLGYDNSELDSLLVSYGFYLADSSLSNYNYTPLSLGSTFNLQYFNHPVEQQHAVAKVLLQGEYSFGKSFLPAFLQQQGYVIRNFGWMDLQQQPAPETRFFQKENISVFYNETLPYRVWRDIGWNMTNRFPGIFITRNYRKAQQRSFAKNRFNFTHTLAELRKQTDTPKLVYAHFFMPHPPFYLNSRGEFNTLFDDAGKRDSLYLEQLRFCNTWIDSLARAASLPFDRPRIVIIEGDHGYRYADDRLPVRERAMRNLSAYYFSDKDYSRLYRSISPVNSFRVVLNKYFNARLPLLADSTVYLQ